MNAFFGTVMAKFPGAGSQVNRKSEMNRKKLRVALVCDWFLPRVGGIELHLFDLARNLQVKGHEAEVITSCPGPPCMDGVRIHRLQVPVLGRLDLGFGIQAEEKARKVLELGRFDVVHGHFLASPLAHGVIYLAKRLGIPTVFTHHSVIDVIHHRPILPVLPWVGSFFGALFYGRLVRPASFVADVVTAVSETVARDVSAIFRNRSVTVLPNGIDPQAWRCERVADGTFHVVSVMRLCRSKRPLQLIRSIARIRARLPRERDPVFTIVGDGPYREAAQREVVRLGLGDRVHLVGMKSTEEIRRILSMSMLFLHTAKREGFGKAVLEALAASVPVVAMNDGGVSEYLTHGREGYLAESFDELAYYAARLIRDDRLRQRMACSAHLAAERFSWNRVIPLHLGIYEEAARVSRNGG